MVLVDTSVWVRFLAGRLPFAHELDQLLDRGEVLAHELVHGELLLGDRGGRPTLLGSYQKLPRALALPHEEVLELVRSRKLSGRGIGWIDAHLLGSALVAQSPLWTADTRLGAVARELEIAHLPSTRF
jgi:predicted nucleic acid-binding protein